MTRKECLDAAAECVLKDRQDQYGKPEDCFGMIARMWGAYLGCNIAAHDVAAMMALLKIARFRHCPDHADNAVDLAGYAACMIETATAWEREGENEDEDVKSADVVVLWKHKPKAESGCCQNGKDQPKFKPGDRVQVRMPAADGDRWEDAVCVSVLPEGTGIRVDYGDYKAIAFGWPNIRPAPKAEGCEEPAYNPDADVVGGVVTLEWPRGKILEKRYASGRDEKCAEGCEDLVFDEARMRESMPSIVPQDGPSDFDAPQTPQELYNRIIANNPATFGDHFREPTKMVPHNPTGEELAEMAEEEKRG